MVSKRVLPVPCLCLALSSLALAFAAGAGSSQAANSLAPEVIYGLDDRQDTDDPHGDHLLQSLARSTALITLRTKITDTKDPSRKAFNIKPLGQAKGLCYGEPFEKQPVGGYCSGFLAAPNILVTAGHCVRTQIRCEQIAIVFGFSYAEGNVEDGSLPRDNVYHCAGIIARQHDAPTGQDFAVIRLDRTVKGRRPLPIRRYGRVDSNARLAAIGHPSGLPTKIANNATVRNNFEPYYFITNTDSFAGSSGSPVVNRRSGLVEGILVRGEKDFVVKGDCKVAYRCQENDCRGEDAVRTSAFAAFIP